MFVTECPFHPILKFEGKARCLPPNLSNEGDTLEQAPDKLTNIRLGEETVTNTLAYYGTKLIRVVKSL